MRKITTILLLLFWKIGFGQNPEIPSTTSTNYIPAAPSVSSLMNFAEIPVNEFTGIPNIQENIFSSKTLSSLINLDISYAYHPKGISFIQKSSDLGTGWSLNCGGSISRMVMFRPEVSNQSYQNLSYADTYFFNFMGFAGSFQIKYGQNNVNPEVIVKRTDQSNLKIEFIKDPNSNKIDSFTIYDTKGIKYVFSVFDINVSTFNMNSPNGLPIGAKNLMKLAYRSSWHLKEIIDNNNKKILNFNYETFTREDNISSISIPLIYSLNKLKEVDVIGFSKINLSYTYSPEMDEINTNYHCDPFNLKAILISDYKNNVIKKIIPDFEYYSFQVLERDNVYPAHINNIPKIRRYLKSIKETNNVGDELNKTLFSYKLNLPSQNLFLDSSGFINAQDACFVKNPVFWNYNQDQLYSNFEFALSNKESSDYGILSGIKYKIGGGYEFLFETNTFSKTLESVFSDISFAKLNDENKQFDLIHNFNYNTANQNYVEFTIPNHSLGSKIYYFKFENQTLNIPPQLQPAENTDFEEVVYDLVNISSSPNNFQILQSFSEHHLSALFNIGENCLGKSIYLTPGTYRINFSAYMNLIANGSIKIYEENYKPNLNRYVYGGGNRIKEIKKYESVSINNLELTDKLNLVNTISFEYNFFNDYFKSSGELSYGGLGNDLYFDSMSSDYQVNYKNVKKIFNNNIGFSKTTFLLPSESSIGYYSIKDGLPLKVELYNSNNELINLTQTGYVFEQDQNLIYALDWNNTNVNRYPTFIKNKVITTNNYFYPSGTSTPNIVTTNETSIYNTLNKQIASHTVNNSVGETLTTNYFYHTGNSPTSQNRISEIERIETKKGTELLSESKINYSNNFAGNQSFLPSTIEVKKGQFQSEVRLRNNLYDEFGHVLEVEQDSGVKTCYVYGYNKTQPIAKIENATYSSIESQVSNLQTISNSGSEEELITALSELRNSLPNEMVTTYTYKPLIGVSTITDPKGDKITYSYDSFGRLQTVKDKDGNVLSENQYNYRPN
jgi:hypothetical protein